MTSVLFHDPDEAAACMDRWTDAYARRRRETGQFPEETGDENPEARAESGY